MLAKKKGLTCERKAIYADIEALRKIGVDIVTVMSPKRGFFIVSRQFEIPKVILLIDAVASAGFITPKKTASLINKLKELVSVGQEENMEPLVYGR
ncbi:MAG: hypothetical protein LUG95_08125 [Clostridiales bacterium]|nr:hypothetical protein [Clostridiales bacterium]